MVALLAYLQKDSTLPVAGGENRAPELSPHLDTLPDADSSGDLSMCTGKLSFSLPQNAMNGHNVERRAEQQHHSTISHS